MQATIETYLLENLVAFARYGTLSAAAQKLHLSQPSLSRSMQRLEELIGVPLFERRKNRLILNEYGQMAARQAERILQQQNDMIDKIRTVYQSHHTISIGGCAPVPLVRISTLLTTLYHGIMVSSELAEQDETLLYRLQKDQLQLAIFHESPSVPELYIRECGTEHLHICLPPTHPLAHYNKVSFQELDGITILQHTNVGFWLPLCQRKMPKTRFLMQDEYDTFTEILSFSSIPSFSSDITMQHRAASDIRRVHVPICDPEASVTYYCACKAENKERFRTLFANL